MINPIQPNTQSTVIPVDTFPGQKLDRSKDIPRPVIDRKKEVPSAREEIPREQVEKAADKLNRLMGIIDKRLEFRVDESDDGLKVMIIEQESGDVMDEISPKRLVDILNTFSQMAGLFFDKRV